MNRRPEYRSGANRIGKRPAPNPPPVCLPNPPYIPLTPIQHFFHLVPCLQKHPCAQSQFNPKVDYTSVNMSSDEVKKAHQVLFDEGMKVRKAVLGAEHVEKSMGAVSDFAMPIQHIVTEACWGAIWTRPGLERKTRSMINIAMLTALNRYHPDPWARRHFNMALGLV